MGKTVEQRKREALARIKLEKPEDINYYTFIKLAARAIDLYIMNGKERVCKSKWCSLPIGARNKTGWCRKCYLRNYKKTGQTKRLDMLRARQYRKRKKLRMMKELKEDINNLPHH